MKTILTILLLCSVALTQEATLPPSSRHCDPAQHHCVLSVPVTQQAAPAQSPKLPRCFVYSRHAMNQCIKDKKWAAELLAQEDASLARPLTIEFPKPSPNITIVAPGGKTAVTINTDTGEIKYGEGVTPSEAAQSFYKAVGALFGNKACDATQAVHAEPTASGGAQVWDGAARDLGQVYIPNQAAKKPKAGSHSEPTGKPDSEKPEKKLP